MFEVGSSIIEEVASTAEALSKAALTPVHALENPATGREPMPQVMAGRMQRRAKVRLALRRGADKSARYPKEGLGSIGVGGRKHGARVVGLSKTTLLDRARTTPFSSKTPFVQDAILVQEGNA